MGSGKRWTWRLVWCGWILVFGCVSATAAPSGLNVIPTADILDKGVMSLEFESAGSGTPWGGDCDNFALLQFGVGYGVELGFDHCTNHPDHWLNVKWRIRDESDTLPAIAIGTQSISVGDRHQPFAICTKCFGSLRGHAGFIGLDSKARWMAGVDHPLSIRFTVQADYISGHENTASFGIAATLTDNLSLTLARSLGNSADVDDGYIVNVSWSMAVR